MDSERPKPGPPPAPPPRVAVFIDYQNVHGWARQLFCDYGTPLHECLVDPSRLAEHVLSKRDQGGLLTQIRVYRGRTDPEKHPTATAAWDAQASRWERDRRVAIIRRQMNYRGWPDEKPREKGIDVRLAVDFVRLAMENKYDVGIMVSSDTDLTPALETVHDLRAAHIEVAAWANAKRLRLPPPNTNRPWCHFLTEDDFTACRDRTDYLKRS